MRGQKRGLGYICVELDSLPLSACILSSPISAQLCCCRLATACIWDCLYSAQSQHVSQLLADGTDHPCCVCVCVCVCWTIPIKRGSVCLCCKTKSKVSDVHYPLWLEESNLHTHTQVTHGCTPLPPPPHLPTHLSQTDHNTKLGRHNFVSVAL